jgi:hypothetical protein
VPSKSELPIERSSEVVRPSKTQSKTMAKTQHE